jgi:hypothetical protein
MAGTFDKTYTGVTWTEGDTATEEKMDNMVNNDQSHDAFAAQGLTFNNTVEIKGKEAGGTARDLIKINASDNIEVGKNNEAGHTVINAGTSKLVKLKVLRQDNTTNAYTANSVILTGWGFVAGTGAGFTSEAITFGITYSERPIICATSSGFLSGSDPTHNGGGSGMLAGGMNAYATSATGATIGYSQGTGFDSTVRVLYSWIAIGALT